MKIQSIDVWNFRLLKEFSILLEDDLSVIIGKNNTGKTSLLAALSKFLGSGQGRKLSFDNINTDERGRICSLLVGSEDVDDDDTILSVGLRLTITYSNEDDLSAVSKLITNLDPDDKKIVLEFYYELPGRKFNELRRKWEKSEEDGNVAAEAFLRQNLTESTW